MHSHALKQKAPTPVRPSKPTRDRPAKPVALAKPEPTARENENEDLKGHPVFMHGLLQRKLAIGASNDPLEQEADHMAEHVMGMREPAAPLRRAAGDCGSHATPARAQMKSTHTGGAREFTAPSIVHDVLNSPGQQLDDATRAYMEPRFGHDFSQVRVHTSAQASSAASSLRASAFTLGRDIVFGAGAFGPNTESGRLLLSHELAHVVQQADSGTGKLLQRQMLPQDKDEKGGEAAKSKSWIEIIPDAALKPKEAKRAQATGDKNAHGKLTDFTDGVFGYHQEGKKEKKHEIVEADALAKGVTEADVDAAVAGIKAARDGILKRDLVHVTNKKQKYRGYKTPEPFDEALAIKNAKKPGAVADADTKKGLDASESYNQWLATTLPTAAKDDKAKSLWEIYKKMIPMEGSPAAINSYDWANLTWGSGFAASGNQLQALMRTVFAKSADALKAFLDAGIALNADEFIVVDTDRKWKLRGFDAQLYIRDNLTLLSLMRNVAQGVMAEEKEKPPPEYRDFGDMMSDVMNPPKDYVHLPPKSGPTPGDKAKQAVLDANYETFLANALKNVPDNILKTWSVDEVALAAHAIHAAPKKFDWTDWSGLKDHSLIDIAEHVLDTAPGQYKTTVTDDDLRKKVAKRKEEQKKAKSKDKPDAK